MASSKLDRCFDLPDLTELPVGRSELERTSPASPAIAAAIVGPSIRIEQVRRMIACLSKSRVPVLILGETGVGKELVARSLHAFAPWRDEPFVPIDCGSLSATLIESELFGHERGAFTGAEQRRIGLLLQAAEGTVFLDEIANLSIETQAKLLRALEERVVRPIGCNRFLPFGARIVAASNQHLEQAVKQGHFRKDLFYRLNVVVVGVPPLRERPEDIAPLAEHFIDCSDWTEREVCGISPESLAYLLRYDWPGNVRELKNCIERALALGSNSKIEVQDLPSNVTRQPSADLQPASPSLRLRDVERNAIAAALAASGGHVVDAARMLGIGKTTIYRKIKEYVLIEH